MQNNTEYNFSPKNFNEFCKTNQLANDEAKTVILQKISSLIDEISKLEGDDCPS